MGLITEDITGASCTGTDGATNRTYTLATPGSTNKIVNIIVENSALNTGDYSYDSATYTITFTNAIFDSFEIRINYLTENIIPVGTTSTYAGTAQLERYMGYDSTTNPYSETQMQESLDRAETEINDRINTKFVDGTAETPAYTQVTDEKHRGKGSYNRDYFPREFPLPDVSTIVSGTAVSEDDTTIWVDDTQGFPASGVIGIETDKITYTGKTSTAFTGCTNVDSSHGTAVNVKPYTFEISSTYPGSSVTWKVLNEGTEFDVDLDSGRFYVYRDAYILDVYNANHPPRVPNRARLNYIAGYSSIPNDITRLTLQIASKDLMHTAVRKAHGLGKDGFDPSLVDVDQRWIDETIKRYRAFRITNV